MLKQNFLVSIAFDRYIKPNVPYGRYFLSFLRNCFFFFYFVLNSFPNCRWWYFASSTTSMCVMHIHSCDGKFLIKKVSSSVWQTKFHIIRFIDSILHIITHQWKNVFFFIYFFRSIQFSRNKTKQLTSST